MALKHYMLDGEGKDAFILYKVFLPEIFDGAGCGGIRL